MTDMLLVEQHLEFLSLKGGFTLEYTLVKMPHCWKYHVAAQIEVVVVIQPEACPPSNNQADTIARNHVSDHTKVRCLPYNTYATDHPLKTPDLPLAFIEKRMPQTTPWTYMIQTTRNNGSDITAVEMNFKIIMSRDMRFQTMWYVQQSKPQISLRIRTV